jgi:hypothetical protein
MVFQLRPLVYSLAINNAPRISFTIEKARVKNIRRFKQGTSRCKMAGAKFHSFAKYRAPICNPEKAARGVKSTDCHNENSRTADCQRHESKFESVLPQARTLRMVPIRSERVCWQSAVRLRAVCQVFITVVANRVI